MFRILLDEKEQSMIKLDLVRYSMTLLHTLHSS